MLDQLALLAIANLVKFLRPKAGIHLTYAGLGVVVRMIADSFNLDGVALNIFQWRIQGWCGLQAVASWLEPSCSEHKPNNQLLCMLLDLRLTISAQNTVRREWAGQLSYIIVQHWVLQQDRSFMLWTLESWWLQPIHRSRADLGNESYPQRQTAEFLQGLECFMRCWVVQCSSEGFSCSGLFPRWLFMQGAIVFNLIWTYAFDILLKSYTFTYTILFIYVYSDDIRILWYP